MRKPNKNRGKGRAVAWLREHASYEGDDCLLWPFGTYRGGYGQFGHDGKMHKAHRFMCELVKGPPPTPTHECAHSCGVAGCVNPHHLSWKTKSENELDRRRHGTSNKGRGALKLRAEDVVAIRASSESPKALAARFGVTENNIRQILWGKTWPEGKKWLHRFTDEEVRTIRETRGKVTARELAGCYGVSTNIIWRIQTGETYKHVPQYVQQETNR